MCTVISVLINSVVIEIITTDAHNGHQMMLKLYYM